MHWFWVTALLILNASSKGAVAAPQSEELLHITPELEVAGSQEHRQSERQSRAMYYTKTPLFTTPTPVANVTANNQTDKEVDALIAPNITLPNNTEIVHPSVEWTSVDASEAAANTTNQNSTQPSTTLTNVTESQNVTFAAKKRNLTRPDFVKDDASLDGVAESRIVTEKPLSLETTFLQTRIPPNIESSRRVKDPSEGGMDTGAIAAIAFGGVGLAALAGSVAFVMYRRRYLNKPQTLNDKCSNPDSSGYLDDSTIRDNSEEMYSLDNDSFLNSLEAMTIQNYWTDTVKHTKL